MIEIVIGNKAYSSWSLRGWLAVRHSGLAFRETLVPMWTAEHDAVRPRLPAGKVPTVFDGDVAVWESLAIIDWLADRVGRDRYWPADEAARAHARSIAAEMHAGFAPMRQQLTMNTRRHYPGFAVNAEAQADIARIEALWTEARGRFGAGGDFLYGDFGAADIMYAPVVTRFTTYDVKLGSVARGYAEAITAHPYMREWLDAAAKETWIVEKYEY
ncbi:MAG: glutathione S-transferase [Alphaproteobacteria bacterium]|nr:glutathione S-transferase [Alphaproteobacteria bacterium]